MRYEEFALVGRDLFASGLISSHGGNLSVRMGDRVLITRRGAMLAHLTDEDIIETGLHKNDSGVALASSEIIVHRAIYRQTNALAVVHAHPLCAVTLSLYQDTLVPVDSEGSYLLHQVPVVAAAMTIGSEEVASLVAPVLASYRVVVVRGHGSFAVGQFLEEAWQWTSALEASCQILYRVKLLGQPIKEYRQQSENYHTW
ncbi:MAG: aldolase [Clostridia bacterium]|nr:MAG: aldolase [Clostridia bacterium]